MNETYIVDGQTYIVRPERKQTFLAKFPNAELISSEETGKTNDSQQTGVTVDQEINAAPEVVQPDMALPLEPTFLGSQKPGQEVSTEQDAPGYVDPIVEKKKKKTTYETLKNDVWINSFNEKQEFVNRDKDSDSLKVISANIKAPIAQGAVINNYNTKLKNLGVTDESLANSREEWTVENGLKEYNNDLELTDMELNPKQVILNKISTIGESFLNPDAKYIKDMQDMLNDPKWLSENSEKEINFQKNLLKEAREKANAGDLLYDFENGGFIALEKANDETKNSNKKINDDANKIAESSDLDYLKEIRLKEYYELLALSKEANKRKVAISEGKSTFEDITQFVGGGFGTNTNFYKDAERLQKNN